MAVDRLKEAFFALVRAGNPGIDYLTSYRARVVKQDADTGKLDVQPDDPRLPSMSNLRLKLGIPGATAQIHVRDAPVFVQVAWENGDPTKPFAALFEGGAAVIKLTLAADTLVAIGDIRLGAEEGGEPPSKATTLKAYLDQAMLLIAAHAHAVSGAVASPSVTLSAPGALTVPEFAATKVEVT